MPPPLTIGVLVYIEILAVLCDTTSKVYCQRCAEAQTPILLVTGQSNMNLVVYVSPAQLILHGLTGDCLLLAMKHHLCCAMLLQEG